MSEQQSSVGNTPDRIHSYNLAFEKAILSTIIFNPETLLDIVDQLKPHHFYLAAHQSIYEAMVILHRSDMPIDESFIQQELGRMKKMDDRVLLEVLTCNPIASLQPYITQIMEFFRKRELRKMAINILKSEEEEKSSDVIVGEIESFISNIDEGVEDMGKNFCELMEEYEKAGDPPTYPSGIQFMDEGVGGAFETGHLVTIAGDPEAGKTILMLQMQKNISMHTPTVMFAFEFTTRSLVKMQKKSDPEWVNHLSATKNLILIDKGFDIADIERKIKRYVRKGVKVFTIDSQMRIENAHFSGFSVEERETEKFSRIAKLAQGLDILIFLIIQTTDTAPDRPIGSKKGAHEASVMIRLKREKPKEGDAHKELRKFIMHKNKMSGQHFEKDIVLNPFTLKFAPPYGGASSTTEYQGHKKGGSIPVEHKDSNGNTTGKSAMKIIEDMAGRDKIDMALL